MTKELKTLIDELYAAEALSAPHPRHEGKESSLHREGLLLDAAKALEALAPDTSAKVDVEWVLQKFIQRADSEYCKGIDMATYDDDTRGWEARAKAGRYGEAEHKAHEKLNKHMGAHYTIYDVVKEVRAALQAPRSDTSAVELVSDNEVLQAMLPAVWTDENVPQFNEALQRLKRAGYGVVKAEQWLKKQGASS